MKNSKLLLTSALVGTVAMGAVANAETKISGGATFTYSAINGTNLAGNQQGAGKEVQIDISNSATLENGVGFSAGFSLEQDGGQSSFDGNEGNFMKFTSGNTSFMYNIDKAANLSTSATPRASTSINTMMAGINGTTAATSSQYDYSPGAQAQQSAWNLEFAQKFDGGTAYVVYVPQQGDAGGWNDGQDTTKTGSAMDVIITGNLGVDGLNVLAAHSSAEPSDTAKDDLTAKMLGVGYNFGKVAAGITRTTINQTNATDNTQTEYGVTYAVSDNMTVGVLRAVTDDSAAGVDDETITAIQVGYNLGALSVEAYGIEVDSLGGTSTAAKQTKFGLRLGTKF
jgi:hypothetical protein